MNPSLEKIINISHYFGEKIFAVQGGGGNTSVKLEDMTMGIKPSGKRLKDLQCIDDLSFVHFAQIVSMLAEKDITEKKFSNKLKEFTTSNTMPRPSIETGFHSFLDKYVAHIHCLYSNVLTCSIEGWQLLQRFFPDATFVGYDSPGRDLTLTIYSEYLNKKSNVIFLKNHGLILHSQNADDIIKIYEELSKDLINYFSLDEFNLNSLSVEPRRNLALIKKIQNNVLFPDQLIYLTPANIDIDSALSISTIDGVKENLWAYEYLDKQIEKLGFRPATLSSLQIENVINSSGEKKRIKEVIK